ncbi:MAG: peptidylprolyl isomerase [Candidatus Sumerlaeia bacterium]|nr:peptidylprolyl isomerase [Candidatus Sumerlaeia bacterium]
MRKLSPMLALLAGATLLPVTAPSQDAPAESAPAAVVAPAPEAKADEKQGPFYAIVDGRKITEAELERAIARTVANIPGIPADQLDAFRAHLRDRVGEQLVMQEAIIAYALKKGLALTKEEKDAKIAEITEAIGGDDAVKDLLEAQNLTREEFESEVEELGIFHKLADTVEAPSEAEIVDVFESNKDRFAQAEEVDASHILLGFTPGETDEQKAEKKKKLEDLRKQIADGGDFAALARLHSTCPSSTRGGDLGSFGRGQMVPPFEQAAFALEAGGLSDIVETQFGYHIIKIAEHRKATEPNLEAAREEIADMLKEQKISELISEIRTQSKVEYPGAEAEKAPEATEAAQPN